MTPNKCIELIEDRNTELISHKVKFIERIKHRIAHNQEVQGKEKIQLGKLYKEIFGVWPFDDEPLDIERRQNTAKLIINTFDDAIQSGILELPLNETNFIGKIQKQLEDKIQVEKKDFNFLFFLSKKYRAQLVSFMPSKMTAKQYGKK